MRDCIIIQLKTQTTNSKPEVLVIEQKRTTFFNFFAIIIATKLRKVSKAVFKAKIKSRKTAEVGKV